MAKDRLLDDKRLTHAVARITERSERQKDDEVLRSTYVDTGVLPHLDNFSHQILYGRRGTGKTHVLKVLGEDFDDVPGCYSIYIDLRVLGSAHLFSDETRSASDRCVAVFKDLLGEIQARLLDIATDPRGDGCGIEEVSNLADAIQAQSSRIDEKTVKLSSEDKRSSELRANVSLKADAQAGFAASNGRESKRGAEESYVEALTDTLHFSSIYHAIDNALKAMGVEHLIIMIDEWVTLPISLQPLVAEFLKRTFAPNPSTTLKIAALEYRSQFQNRAAGGSPVGFELGADIKANLDLDDYYVYERNRVKVQNVFEELIFQHMRSNLSADVVVELGLTTSSTFRKKLFTEEATFVELVRAGEGVVRDFLGIFQAAFLKAKSSNVAKIDLHSVEEAARDWYETDKSTDLSDGQHEALRLIIDKVIGRKQSKMFMLLREHADHPMVQSLFDLRLLHLMERGYSDKRNPGLRYNIYAIDYGAYVDLKRTKSEPEGLFETAEGFDSDLSEDRVVPFQDKRSIRRVILDPMIFDEAKTIS